MSEKEENVEEETVKTESETETTEEKETPEKTCLNIPDHLKPLFECCRDFEEGKIESSDFFAKALIHTGEFMQKVKNKPEESEESE